MNRQDGLISQPNDLFRNTSEQKTFEPGIAARPDDDEVCSDLVCAGRDSLGRFSLFQILTHSHSSLAGTLRGLRQTFGTGLAQHLLIIRWNDDHFRRGERRDIGLHDMDERDLRFVANRKFDRAIESEGRRFRKIGRDGDYAQGIAFQFDGRRHD